MSTSETITRTDLANILNEVLPNPTMLKTVQYTATISWYSTSNPFGDVLTDIEIDGWTPIGLSYLVGGSLSSFVSASQIEITVRNGTTVAHGYFRMYGQTPSSTTQNSVMWTVIYIKNAPMVEPPEEYFTATRNSSATDGTFTGIYYPNSGIVTFTLTIRFSSNIGTNTTLFTIPEKYRPKSNKVVPAIAFTDANAPITYAGTIYTSGVITQNATGHARQVFVSGSYSIT